MPILKNLQSFIGTSVFKWGASRTFNRLIFLALALLGILIFFFLFWYADLGEIISLISSLSVLSLLAVLGFIFVVFWLAAWRWQIILRGYGYEIKRSRLSGLVFRSAAISLIFPSFEISGETFKAFRLRQAEVSTPASFASVFFDYFIVLITNIVFGIGLLIFVFVNGLPGGRQAFVTGWPVLGLVFAAVSLYFILKKFFKRGWFSQLIIKSSPVIHYVDDKTLEDIKLFDFGISFFLKESKKYLALAFLTSFLGFLWEMGQIFLGLLFLGVEPQFLTVVIYYLAINFFNSVPVFGGIGFGEAGAFLAGSSLGIPDSTSLALVLLLRLKQLEIILIGGWLFIKDSLAGLSQKIKSSRSV